jgi:hypothetical protein
MVLVGALPIASAMPIVRSSARANGDIEAPPEIALMLRHACYDCHSDETRWPWYTRIPLLSRLAAKEVDSGRRQVNFSRWDSYYPATRRRKLEWIGRALQQQDMPPLSYRMLHPDARLTTADRTAIERWIDSQLAYHHAPAAGDRVSK